MGRCEKLKWNRRKLGMTQEELAKKVGVSQSTISELERDENAWNFIKDSTDDAIYDTLRSLGTWNCNINGVFKDNPTDDDIRDVREKRLELGMSQRDLAMILGLDSGTICHYEKHDKYWNSKKSAVVSKLVAFVDGKYDVGKIDDNTSKKVTNASNDSWVAVGPNVNGVTVKNDINEMFPYLIKLPPNLISNP